MLQDNLKKIREERGLTKRDLCEKTGISERAYLTYEFGEREPKVGVIQKLADFYGVTTDYLLGREPAPDPFGDYQLSEEDEKEVIEKYMSFPPEIRACLMDVLIKLGEAAKRRADPVAKAPAPALWSICCGEYSVSAGTGTELDTYERFGKIDVVDTPEARRADYGLRVSGDSMEPVYHNGDIVLVKQADTIDEGEIGIFVVNGEGFIKKLGRDCLVSLNPAYKDIPLHEDDAIKCCGKVIGVAKRPV